MSVMCFTAEQRVRCCPVQVRELQNVRMLDKGPVVATHDLFMELAWWLVSVGSTPHAAACKGSVSAHVYGTDSPSLERLLLHRCDLDMMPPLRPSRISALQAVRIEGCSNSHGLLAAIANSALSLHSLVVRDDGVVQAPLQDLIKRQRVTLQHVELVNCPKLEALSSTSEHALELPALRVLDLSGCGAITKQMA
jgi:hypothetical protein